MSGASLPPGCLLDHRVRTEFNDYDLEDQIALQPFRIRRCVEKKASGFPDQTSANKEVEGMQIGVHLADAPPGLSCLGLRGGSPSTGLYAVDKNIIVLKSTFLNDFSQHVYLVYDAIKGLLHMIPFPQHPSWRHTSHTARVVVARPRHGRDESLDYALLLAGENLDDGGRWRDDLLLWRPTSSSPPWSEVKASFPDKYLETSYKTDMAFSFDGHGYWVDLLRVVSCCSYDALFDNNDRDNNTTVLEFGFIPLPVNTGDHRRGTVAEPKAYRTMGVAQDSIRFVSIDGFLEHVDLKDRTLTVWKLLGHDDMGWELEYELRLETLWGLQGFHDDLPKDSTPMYPLLSTADKDVVYFALGDYREHRENRSKWEPLMPVCIDYMIAVNMRNNIIQASYCFGSRHIPDLVSSDFSQYLCTVGHDLYIMMRETVKQISSLMSSELDPLDYDEAEAKEMIKGPWSWKETPKKEEDGRRMINGNRGFPALVPSSYYFCQPY